MNPYSDLAGIILYRSEIETVPVAVDIRRGKTIGDKTAFCHSDICQDTNDCVGLCLELGFIVDILPLATRTGAKVLAFGYTGR